MSTSRFCGPIIPIDSTAKRSFALTWDAEMDLSRDSSALRRRLRHLATYCAQEEDPGLKSAPQWRDWSHRLTTADQARIERFLEGRAIPAGSILHVGIGNSQLAHRFAGRAERIDGITVVREELDHAMSLGVSTYRPALLNKYAWFMSSLRGPYDVIVDNNPMTFACCYIHLDRMFAQYVALLAPTGLLLTDQEGLGWVLGAAPPDQMVTYEDWQCVGRTYGLVAERQTDTVYSLRRG